jgi:hypothetical protein
MVKNVSTFKNSGWQLLMTSEDKALHLINIMIYFSKYRDISGNLSSFTAEQLTAPHFAYCLLNVVVKKA